MQIDAVQLLVQAGALGLFGLFLWKMFGPMLNRVMDNLDQQTKNYQEGIKVQAEVAAELRALRGQIAEGEEGHEKATEAQENIAGVLRGIQQQFQAHEGRAHQRHEKQMQANTDHEARANERHEQRLEMDREVVAALKALNGHSK